jgi:hypothetical protein
MEFRKVEGREKFYRAVVDSTWWGKFELYHIPNRHCIRQQKTGVRAAFYRC